MLRISLPDMKIDYVFQALSEVYDWGLIDLHIPDIHKQTLGEGIKIGIVDSGRSDHFEVEHNTASSANFTDATTESDRYGHSTFVSGILAAEKNNEGIIGVAPKAQLYFAKALNDSGSGQPTWMVEAINWCIEQEVDIISVSAGIFFDFKPVHKIVKRAYNRNILVVAATGNTGSRHYDVAFPARYPEVIGVAAYNKSHTVAKFSSRGTNVSFAMPGVDIYSTHLDNQFCKSSGTSFACPLLSGICALILSKHRNHDSGTPCVTSDQMFEHLQKYSIPLGSQNETGFGTIDLEGLFSED